MAGGFQYADLVEGNADRDLMSFTIADGTQVSKGILMKLTDPRTAIATTAGVLGNGDPMAGISFSEKNFVSIEIYSSMLFVTLEPNNPHPSHLPFSR